MNSWLHIACQTPVFTHWAGLQQEVPWHKDKLAFLGMVIFILVMRPLTSTRGGERTYRRRKVGVNEDNRCSTKK